MIKAIPVTIFCHKSPVGLSYLQVKQISDFALFGKNLPNDYHFLTKWPVSHLVLSVSEQTVQI